MEEDEGSLKAVEKEKRRVESGGGESRVVEGRVESVSGEEESRV